MKYNTIDELRKDWPEIPVGRAEDLSGKHINNLTVLYRCIPNDKYKTPRWACRCDCGLYFTVAGGNIRQNKQISCGCEGQRKSREARKRIGCAPNHEDLTDKQFGYLTAKEYIGKDKNNHAIWRCECRCGNFVAVTATHLKTHHTTSCGCRRSSQYEDEIVEWLDTHKQNYEREVSFSDLGKLRFDFKIYSGSSFFLLEMQGQQHFTPSSKFGGKTAFEKLQANDQLKKQYCEKNNISLYYITYKDNIAEKLSSIIK